MLCLPFLLHYGTRGFRETPFSEFQPLVITYLLINWLVEAGTSGSVFINHCLLAIKLVLCLHRIFKTPILCVALHCQNRLLAPQRIFSQPGIRFTAVESPNKEGTTTKAPQPFISLRMCPRPNGISCLMLWDGQQP